MKWNSRGDYAISYTTAIRLVLLITLLGGLALPQELWAGQHYLPAVHASTGATVYYVDCLNGNDANDGLSPARAWRKLERVNRATIKPGEQLMFKRGCGWVGPLEASWQGTGAAPIYIGAYGSGADPLIEKAQYAVVIRGQNLIIQNIHARGAPTVRDPGCENQGRGWQIGFRFEPGAAYNTLRWVRATGLTHGVKITRDAHHNRIIRSTFRDNTQMFLLDASNPNNDAGANGVVIEGDDNEVAYNEFIGHTACSFDYGRDGSAIEIVGAQRNRIHHNRAHNNVTFVELGDKRSADNTFAYNLVTADIRMAHFLISEGATGGRGPILRTRAYHNTVYLTDSSSIAVNCDGSCTRDILSLRNNIIWSEGRIGYIDTRSDEGRNLFWRSDGKPQIFFPTPSDRDPSSIIADPSFRDRANGNFRLNTNSPAVNKAGTEAVSLGYTSDLADTPVPRGAAPDIGAYEVP
jgi:hypothetical protein